MAKKIYGLAKITPTGGLNGWYRACTPHDISGGEFVHVFERDIFTQAARGMFRPLGPSEQWRELVATPNNYGRLIDYKNREVIITPRKKPYVFLRIGDDYLSEATRYSNKTRAIEAFRQTALELARCGQAITATLHFAVYRDDLDEYPDFVLSLTERGAVSCTAA